MTITVNVTSEGRTFDIGENTLEAARQASIATDAAETAIAASDSAAAAATAAQAVHAHKALTKAAADALLPLPENEWVIVWQDETQGGVLSLYRVEGGALVYKGDQTHLFATSLRTLTAMFPGQNYVDGGGNSNRVDLSIFRSINNFAANHEGSGAPYAYQDQVAGFAVGLQPDATRTNPDMAGCGWFFEPLFYQAGVFAFEVQLRFRGLDDAERRPIQFFLPVDGGTVRGIASVQYQVDRFRIHDWLDVPMIDINVKDKVVQNVTGVSYRFDTQNASIFRQLNAAGNAYLQFGFYDSDDFFRYEAPGVRVAAAKANSVYGQTAFEIGHCLSLPANGVLDNKYCGGLTTGNASILERRVHATGRAQATFENTNNGSTRVDVKAVGDDAGYQVNGQDVLLGLGEAIANPAAATYSAPSGGTTVDTEARDALAQLAADNAALRTALTAILTRMRAKKPSIAA